MNAAIVSEKGKPPLYGEFPGPSPKAGKSVVRVTAASLSQLTRARASGGHYSSDGVLPFVPGVDGTGTLEDGTRVYFLSPETPFGAMAEYSIADWQHVIAIPEALSDVLAAAMAIPGMSSWAALVERAHLASGETVLVNGATGSSGRLAIQIAKHLGAKKVIATGRQTGAFEELLALGADVTVPLVQDKEDLERAFRKEFEQGVDVVLDYLWGPSAESLIVAAAKASPESQAVRFVQIGSISGANVDLPGAALRSSGLQLMGSGIGSVPLQRLLASIQGVLAAAPEAGFKIATKPVPLADVGKVWSAGDADGRIVLLP